MLSRSCSRPARGGQRCVIGVEAPDTGVLDVPEAVVGDTNTVRPHDALDDACGIAFEDLDVVQRAGFGIGVGHVGDRGALVNPEGVPAEIDRILAMVTLARPDLLGAQDHGLVENGGPKR